MFFLFKTGDGLAQERLAVVFGVMGVACVQTGFCCFPDGGGGVEIRLAQREKKAARLLLCHLGKYPDAAFRNAVQGGVHGWFHKNRSFVVFYGCKENRSRFTHTNNSGKNPFWQEDSSHSGSIKKERYKP